MKPYPLYLSKDNGVTLVDTYKRWGIVCKDIPLQLFPEAKDLPNNDWADEDGEDTYIPNNLKFKPYDLTIEWVYNGFADVEDDGTYSWPANQKIQEFMEYISGRIDGKVSMSITDTYTQISVNTYFKKAEQDAFYRMSGNEEVVTFKTTHRVVNPVPAIIDSNLEEIL